jgi:hypothetical protein
MRNVTKYIELWQKLQAINQDFDHTALVLT